MFFNKWKKRALEEREQVIRLETELDYLRRAVKQLEATHRFVDHSDLARKVLDLKCERKKQNLPTDKLYIRPSELSDFLAETSVFKDSSLPTSVTMLFGLTICYTANDMRVE